MLPPARRLAAWLAASVLLLSGGAALAANFSGGAVTGCSIDAATKTYTCGSLPLPEYNTVTTIANGYTVVVSSSVALGYNHTLQMSGTAKLQSSGDIDLAGVNGPLLNISGGTLAAAGAVKLGNQTQTITVNINAQSVSVGSSATKITGTVTATGAITTGSNVTINGAVTSSGGAISFGTDNTINGAVSGASITTGSNVKLSSTLSVGGAINLGSDTAISGAVDGASITTGSNVKLSSTLSVTGAINLGSGNTISGTVGGASIKTNSNVAMGPLTVTGAADLGSANTINGKLTANSLKTDSGVTITGAVKTEGLAELGSAIKINGGVDAGSVKTGSPGQINGGIISKAAVDLGSGLTITGNVKGTVITSLSPVTITGNVDASTSFTLPSGSVVNGNVAGGALTILDGGSTINGNVTMTGDVYIGSSGRINGDLKAYNVNTHSSDAIVSGNAAVNSIYLDFGARVNKTITCTGAAPGAAACSCVTKAESSYSPTCSATPPAAAGPHHIQISHYGTALTCQPQTVTLTACANASCTAPHYTAAFSGTLSPGNLPFSIAAGNGTATGLVQQTTTTPIAMLSATSTALNPSTCVNPSNTAAPCAMTFSNTGLIVTVPDHLSMASVNVTVQALQAQNNNQSCVPLLKDVNAAPIDFNCEYSDPVPGKAAKVAPQIQSPPGADTFVGAACGTVSTVKLNFNGSGIATAKFQYPEVGKVVLKASYTASTGFNAIGNTSFTAAPARIDILPQRVTNAPALTGDVFANASAPFTVKLSAVNTLGNVTTNFGKEQTPENFKPAFAIAPANPNGVVTPGKFIAIDNGVSSSVKDTTGYWNYSDVGNITISASLANSTSNYLGNPAPGFNTQGTKTLRFIPDHFDVLLPNKAAPSATRAFDELPSNQIAGMPMPCGQAGGLSNPCGTADGSGNFIYSKQPFYVVVKAYNGAAPPALTQNYITDTVHTESSLAKPITLSAWTTSGGATASPVGAMVHAAPAAFTFTKGVGILPYVPIDTQQMQNTDATLPNFTLTTAPTLPAKIYVRAVDTDTATSARIGAASTEIPLTVVSGRMTIANNYGSTGSSMPVNVQALYYSAAGAWVFNAAYASDAQGIGTGNISYANCKSGGATVTCPALAVKGAGSLTFAAGKSSFLLSSPIAGSADVTLYPDHWSNNYLPAPTPGRATFGIYRSGPVIYTREVHN
jgi:MSHA biogenesis protein MshQ